MSLWPSGRKDCLRLASDAGAPVDQRAEDVEEQGFGRSAHAHQQATAGGPLSTGWERDLDAATVRLHAAAGMALSLPPGRHPAEPENMRRTVMSGFRLASLASLSPRRRFGSPAAADPVADFYKGKTIQMVIGVSAGGDYDLRARLLAKHLPKYIPGNPNIVAQNMLGGGGLNAANWLANVAPKRRHRPAGDLVDAAGQPGRRAARASSSTSASSTTSATPPTRRTSSIPGTRPAITKIEQVFEKELVVGSTGRSSGSYYYPAALNAWAGTKFKIVLGLSGRRQCQHRHGARRGRRPRLQHLGVVEVDAPAMARREEDPHAGAGRAQAESGASRTFR